jgi:ABC-type Zn uptake system ZnuABC Zn-binding protein ZnuA
VIQAVKRTGAKAIVMEPFYDRKVADLVAKQTGIKVLVLPPSVGGVPGAVPDYISLMKYDMSQLADSVK